MDEEKPKEKGWTRRQVLIGAGVGTLATGASIAGLGYMQDQRIKQKKEEEPIDISKCKLTSDSGTFPYSFSPFEEYARIEEETLNELKVSEKDIPRDYDRIIKIADDISDRVAIRILQSERKLSIDGVIDDFPKEEFMTMLAEEMANTGLITWPEQLLSRGFSTDPQVQEEGMSHLDCDLLAYLMMHAGRRMGVDMYAVPGPIHMYFMVRAKEREEDPNKAHSYFVMEPTKFRRVERKGGWVNRGVKGIEEGFFSTFEKQRRHGGISATKRLEEAAQFHKRITDEERLRESMYANIIQGVWDEAERKDDYNLMTKTVNRMATKVVAGTTSYLIANNLIVDSLKLADKTWNLGDRSGARTLLKNAIFTFKEYEPMVIQVGRIERKIAELKSRMYR